MEFDQRMQRKSLANGNINKYNKHLYIVPIKCVVWKLEKDQGFVMMLSFAFNYIFIIFLKSLQWLWFLAKKKNVASLYLSSVKHGQAQKKKKKNFKHGWEWLQELSRLLRCFLYFFPPSSLGSLFSFILHLFLHLYPTRGQLMIYADTCLINLL